MKSQSFSISFTFNNLEQKQDIFFNFVMSKTPHPN